VVPCPCVCSNASSSYPTTFVPHFYSSKGANEGGRGKKGITVRVTVSGSTSLSWNPGRTTD
jgi:hypothetical protein